MRNNGNSDDSRRRRIEHLNTKIPRTMPQPLFPLDAAGILGEAIRLEDGEVALAIVNSICARADNDFSVKIAQYDKPQGRRGIVLNMELFWHGMPVAGAVWSDGEPDEDGIGVPHFFE